MKLHNFKTLLYTGISSILLFSGCLKEDTNYASGKNNEEVSLYVIRNHFKDAEITLDTEKLEHAVYTKALVVSSHESNNFPSNYIAVQNSWRNQLRGILMEVDDASKYKLGDSIQINLEGLKLSRKNGSLVLNGLNANSISTINRDNAVQPRAISIGALNRRFNDYESTYIEITADLETEPIPGTPIKGNKPLVDNEQNIVNLFISDQATFAEEPVYPSATFRGIAFKNNDDIQLRLLTYDGMAYPSGKIYPNWPETFESPDRPKGSYNMPEINNNAVFHTGEWHLYQAIYGDIQGRDRIVSGQYAIRMQQNRSDDEYLQMNFDVPEGASKVTLFYGSYYTDRSCTFQLEYSQDEGATWRRMGEPISDAHTTTESMDSKQAIFLMDLEGPVRFRINKLGLGSSNATVSNGRLGIDDFAIYKYYEINE